jgi:hypothetical protein
MQFFQGGGVMIVAILAACGDNAGGPVPAVEPRCSEVPWTGGEQFSRSSELGPVVSYSLGDDFDPSGRWFFTGVALGSISVIRDSDGTLQLSTGGVLEHSSTELFSTYLQEIPELPLPDARTYRITRRISNLRDDGSLRYDEVFCEKDTCSVCTATMIRAERHDPQPSEGMTT